MRRTVIRAQGWPCAAFCLWIFMSFLAAAGCGGGNAGDESGSEPTDVVAGGEVAGDVACPEGLEPWPGSATCAPVVGPCENPWELPLFGGGCVVVGPRSCRSGWDPQAVDNCDPGKLLPCPEGFVESDDKVYCEPNFYSCSDGELPTPGGGCLEIGAQPEVPDPMVPEFAKCGAGQVALEGGECQAVGPRACSKLWNDEAEQECEVGDVEPCSQGWFESDDGHYCEPAYDECGEGELPILGGGCSRVLSTAEDCPEGPFPPLQEEWVEVFYVLAASDCEADCGSAQAPFSSIGEALEGAPAGAAVLVGSGVYEGGLEIDQPVVLAGLCAALVTVTGALEIADESESKLSTAGIVLHDVAGASMSGISVQSSGAGVVVLGGKAALSEMEIADSTGVGLYAGQGAELTVADSWIHGGLPDEIPGSDGFGIWAVDGAQLELSGTLVEGAAAAGIYVKYVDSYLMIQDSTVRGTQYNANGFGGNGLRLSGPVVDAVRVVFEKNRSHALSISSGAELSMADSVVRWTQSDVDGENGFGASIGYAASASIDHCLFHGNRGMGTVANSNAAQLSLTRSVVRNTLPQGNGLFGAGVAAINGGDVFIEGSIITGSHSMGISSAVNGSQVVMRGSMLAGTRVDDKGTDTFAVLAMQGAGLDIAYSTVENNESMGIVLQGEGSTAVLDHVAVRDTILDASGVGGAALALVSGAVATLSNCVMERSFTGAVAAMGEGADLQMESSVVRDTEPDGNGEVGAGVVAFSGASVTLSGTLIDNNTEIGVAALDEGSVAVVEASVVRGTRHNEKTGNGYGVEVGEGGSITMSDSVVEGNAAIGVALFGPGGENLLERVVVRNTLPDLDGSMSFGLQVSQGTSLTLIDSRIDDNRDMGMKCVDLGTEVLVQGTLVQDTGAGRDVVEGSTGLYAASGCHLVVDDTTVKGTVGVGVVAVDEETMLEMSNCAVVETANVGNNSLGYGLQIAYGSTANIDHSVFQKNHGIGLYIAEYPATVLMADSAVLDTAPDADGYAGYALQATDGAKVTIDRSLLARNTSIGILTDGIGTAVHMDSSAIQDTRVNSGGFAFGIQASGQSEVIMSQSQIVGSAAVAVNIWGTDTRVLVERSVVRKTFPDFTEELGECIGIGIYVRNGGRAQVEASLLEENGLINFWSQDFGCLAVLEGSIVRNPWNTPDDLLASGVLASDGGEAEVYTSLITNNSISGVGAFNQSRITVLDSAILDTRRGGNNIVGVWGGGEDSIFGDAILAGPASTADVARTLMTGSARCGAVYYKASGTIENSLIIGNAAYGLAMQDSGKSVNWENRGTLVLGNCVEFSCLPTEEITDNPGGLPVPVMPELTIERVDP